jgi:hypothetical protein
VAARLGGHRNVRDRSRPPFSDPAVPETAAHSLPADVTHARAHNPKKPQAADQRRARAAAQKMGTGMGVGGNPASRHVSAPTSGDDKKHCQAARWFYVAPGAGSCPFVPIPCWQAPIGSAIIAAMPSREPSKPVGYTEWRARAVAAIGAPNLLFERHWRRMFIMGRTIDAAEAGNARLH